MSRLKVPVMALEPSLWGTLPKELLHLVFARLSIVGIGQLRVLSKEWKKNIDCKDSEFNQVLDATNHLNMFALLYMRYSSRMLVSGNIYDVQVDKWHGYEMDAVLAKVKTLDGADGGLVCCVLKWRVCDDGPWFLIVMNPLLKQKMQLPPLLCIGAEKSKTLVRTVVRMVKLTMDRKTKEYKVFVVGSIAHGGQGFFAQVYDSHIKEWMVVEATQGHIIGWDHLDSDYPSKFLPSLCVYDCDEGTLQQFNEINIAPRLGVEPGCCVLLEDHLFMLHKEASPSPPDLLEDGASMLSKYCISEFHLPEKSTAWVKLGVHSCGPCTFFRNSRQSIIKLRLWGCNRLLLVYGDGCEQSWLYNLSTREWRNLPAFEKPLYPKMMCTISWSAVA